MIADKSVRQGRDSCVTAPGPSRPFQLAFCRTHSLPSRRRPHIGLFKTHTHTHTHTHVVYTETHIHIHSTHTHTRARNGTHKLACTHTYTLYAHTTHGQTHTLDSLHLQTHTQNHIFFKYNMGRSTAIQPWVTQQPFLNGHKQPWPSMLIPTQPTYHSIPYQHHIIANVQPDEQSITGWKPGTARQSLTLAPTEPAAYQTPYTWPAPPLYCIALHCEPNKQILSRLRIKVPYTTVPTPHVYIVYIVYNMTSPPLWTKQTIIVWPTKQIPSHVCIHWANIHMTSFHCFGLNKQAMLSIVFTPDVSFCLFGFLPFWPTCKSGVSAICCCCTPPVFGFSTVHKLLFSTVHKHERLFHSAQTWCFSKVHSHER